MAKRLLSWHGKTQIGFFSALGSETEEQDKFATDNIRFEKVIRTLAFRGREKFDNSFYFKILGIVDSQLYKL